VDRVSLLTAANIVFGLALFIGGVCLIARRNDSTERALACWGAVVLCVVAGGLATAHLSRFSIIL